jgi:ankyrin repeat protein
MVQISVTDRYGQPLLRQAASNGHDDVIRLLLSHGIDVNTTDPGATQHCISLHFMGTSQPQSYF